MPGSYGAFPAASKTRSQAADDAGMQRIRRASENILGSTVRLSRKKSVMFTPLLAFILTYQKVHCAVRCDATVFYWLAFASSQPMGIWHTWKSSHSHSHCHMYSSHSHSHLWHICVPIPMGFPRESHFPFPCTSLPCNIVTLWENVTHTTLQRYGKNVERSDAQECNVRLWPTSRDRVSTNQRSSS